MTPWVIDTNSSSSSSSWSAVNVTPRHWVGPELPDRSNCQPTDGTHLIPFSSRTPSM